MIQFLVSNLKHYHKENGENIANPIDNKNGLADQMKQALPPEAVMVYIPADCGDVQKADRYFSPLHDALRLSGIGFSEFSILDERREEEAVNRIARADLIFLGGGDPYKQHCFLEKIGLKNLLSKYSGIVLGQSAGAINMAREAFNSPEEGEGSENIHFQGLGLTEINVEPHFTCNREAERLNCYEILTAEGMDTWRNERYQREAVLRESRVRTLYGLPDGSHIRIENGEARLFGEGYRIRGGRIEKICEDGRHVRLGCERREQG